MLCTVLQFQQLKKIYWLRMWLKPCWQIEAMSHLIPFGLVFYRENTRKSSLSKTLCLEVRENQRKDLSLETITLQTNLFWSHWFCIYCRFIKTWWEGLKGVHIPSEAPFEGYCQRSVWCWTGQSLGSLWGRFRCLPTWRAAVTPPTSRCLNGVWHVKIQQWWPNIIFFQAIDDSHKLPLSDICTLGNLLLVMHLSNQQLLQGWTISGKDWHNWPGSCSQPVCWQTGKQRSCLEHLPQMIWHESCLWSHMEPKHPNEIKLFLGLCNR